MRAVPLAGALLLVAASASAQVRTMTVERRTQGESRLTARLAFSAGSVRVVPAPAGTLYAMALAYDGSRFTPIAAYDAPRAELQLGVRPTGGALTVASQADAGQAATIQLSPTVVLSLDGALGAAESDLELGGLTLDRLRLQAGASRSLVRFSRPLRGRCRSAEFEAGAASLTVSRLGNASCAEVTFAGGVGRLVVDLGGAWTADGDVDIRLTLGQVELLVPRSLGVRLETQRFLSGVEASGFTRQGDAFVTEGFERAARKVRVRVASTIGGIVVTWVD